MKRCGSLLPDERIGKTIHDVGTPSSLGGSPEALPATQLLIIEERPDGYFLFRFSADDEVAGDTWHLDLKAAQDQAAFEFGDRMHWLAIPEAERDVRGWLRGRLHARS